MSSPPEDSGQVRLLSSPRDKSTHRPKTTDRFQKNLLCGSILKGYHKSLGRFRSDREKTRKTEISRDFSAFFAPNFFQISIDPFSIFLRVEGFELPKMHFFKNRITTASDRKDLNPRQGFKFFRFFALDTNCLQTVPSKTDPSLLR